MKKITLAQLLLCAVLCAALSPSAAWAKDPFAPPAGISPTSATLDRVLEAARKADGSDKTYSTRVTEGHVTAWGMKGAYKGVVSGDDYKSTVDLGPLSWQNGRVSGQLWRRNVNGLVIPLHDIHNGEQIDAEAIALYRKHPSSDLSLLGETSGPGAAYVVEVHPKGGNLEWFFFDKKSYLVTRIEVPSVDERDTITYSDFHKTGPYTDAWHIHVSNGISQNDVDYAISTKYNVAVTAADTAMPQSNDKLVQFPTGVNVVDLPAKIVNKEGRTKLISVENANRDITQSGDMTSNYRIYELPNPHIVVQLTINGHGYDFYLDSGSGGIFIDSDQAEKLGLKTFGPSQQTPFGKWVSSFALIPELRVGDITMTNVVVDSLPSWYDDPQVGTKIVGIVGYDFIANAVLKIDYEKGS